MTASRSRWWSHLLLLLGLLPLRLAAADSWDAAKARHAWTWFALSEEQAAAEARRQGGTLVVERRDGKESPAERPAAGLVVAVHLHGGRVLWAQAHQGQAVHSEGVADIALLPWLGLPEADATAQARAAGRAVRVVARDGGNFPVTLDFNAERVNLHVLKGVVVAITLG